MTCSERRRPPRPLGLLVLALAWLAPGGCNTPDGHNPDGQSPDDEALELLRARNAVAQGRHDWARLHFARHLEQHPDDLDALRGEAWAWMSGYQQSLTTATERLEAYLSRRDDDTEALRRLVGTLVTLGRWPEARMWAARLGKEPEDDLLRARAWLETDPATARQAATAAVARQPERSAAWAILARAHERLGEADSAADAAARAVHLDPTDDASLYLLARAARRRGELDLARLALERHQALRQLRHDGTMAPPPPRVVLEQMRQVEESVAAERGVEIAAVPFPLDWQLQRLAALYAVGDLAAASELTEDLRRAPRVEVATLLDLATRAGEAGVTQLARSLFAQALERQASLPGAVASLAQLDLQAGNVAAARRHLEAGVDADPWLARHRYLLGRVAVAEDDVEAAIADLERAVDLAPWEWPWRRELADLLLGQGRDERVRELLAEVPEQTPAIDAYRRQHARRLSP